MLKARYWSVLIIGVLGLPTHSAPLRAVDAPPARVIYSEKSSALESVVAQYFSEAVEIPENLKSRVFTGVDLVQLEVDHIDELINREGPNSDKKIIYVRYTSGDMRLARALARAKHAGIDTIVMIDLNPVLTAENGDSSGGMTNDFSKLKAIDKDSPGYKAYLYLLGEGFDLGKTLFSQPIYSRSQDERTPIFHEKALALKQKGLPTTLLVSSANSAPNPRINRTLKFNDQDIAEYYEEHVEDLKAIFSSQKALPISELPARAPLEVRYKDRTKITLAFTDGKYNPGDSIAQIFRTKHLKSVLISQFAFTYDFILDSLVENLLVISPEATLTGLFDDRFADLVSHGVALTMKGAMVTSPPFPDGGTRLIFPKPKEFAERADIYIYQRAALDPETNEIRIEDREDGAPIARHLNHEKTIVSVDTAGNVYISFGTQNASANFHNADMLFLLEVPEGSWLHQGFETTIRGVIERDKNVYAIPAQTATIRNALGMLTGHTDLEIPVTDATAFSDAFWKSDWTSVNGILQRSLAKPVILKDASPLPNRQKQTNVFFQFLQQYRKRLYPRHVSDFQFMKVLSIVPLVAQRPMTDYAQRALAEGLYFGVINDDAKRAQQVESDLKLFGLSPRKTNKRAPKELIARGFDWDNTVMVMPTMIRIFNKHDSSFKEISTEEFAFVRKSMGEPGTEFADWEFRYPDSFYQFQAAENWREGYFVPQFEVALQSPDGRAEAFDKLIDSLSSQKSAKVTSVITSRNNSQQELVMVVVRLRQVVEKEIFDRTGRKIRLYLPPRENFRPQGKAGANISEAKAKDLLVVAPKHLKYGATAYEFFEDDAVTRKVVIEAAKENMDPKDFERFKVIDPKDLCEKRLEGESGPPSKRAS